MTGHPPASPARRRAAVASLAALSAITGIVSYEHGLAVVRLVGNTGLVAYLVPLVPDLMIVSSSMTLMEASAMKTRRPVMAVFALLAGIGWTVAMNVAAGARDGAGGGLVAGGVPLAFVVTFESLVWLYRNGRTAAPLAVPGQCPHTVALSAEDAVRIAHDHARDCLGEALSQRQLSARFGVTRPRVAELVKPSPSDDLPEHDDPAVVAAMNGGGRP